MYSSKNSSTQGTFSGFICKFESNDCTSKRENNFIKLKQYVSKNIEKPHITKVCL